MPQTLIPKSWNPESAKIRRQLESAISCKTGARNSSTIAARAARTPRIPKASPPVPGRLESEMCGEASPDRLSG